MTVDRGETELTDKTGHASRVRLTTGFIANYCQVSKTTVLQWIRDNRLRAYSLPSGHYRVSKEDFRDFLEQNDMPINDSLFESKSKGTSH